MKDPLLAPLYPGVDKKILIIRDGSLTPRTRHKMNRMRSQAQHTPSIDPVRYATRVRALEAFGHRGSATDNERKAAEYLAGELRGIGIAPIIEPFRGARAWPARILVHVFVAVVGLALAWWMPLLSIALAAVTLGAFLLEEARSIPMLSWPVCRYASQNVFGIISSTRPARRRIVLSAHYDTQPTGWVWRMQPYLLKMSWRSPLWMKPPMIPALAMMFAQIAIGVLQLVIGRSLPVLVLIALLLTAYTVLSVVLMEWALGKYVPGAADNASGVAAVLELASAWLTSPPADDVELVVLFPGCEESGLLGAAAWADRHRRELRELATVFLNIDSIGFGPPRFLGAEVPVAGRPLRADAQLIEQCQQIAAELGLKDAGPHVLPGPTDAYALLARGHQAITLCGFQEGGLFPNYHTMAETTQNMDFASAQAATEFARALCWKMAMVGGGNGCND